MPRSFGMPPMTFGSIDALDGDSSNARRTPASVRFHQLLEAAQLGVGRVALDAQQRERGRAAVEEALRETVDVLDEAGGQQRGGDGRRAWAQLRGDARQPPVDEVLDSRVLGELPRRRSKLSGLRLVELRRDALRQHVLQAEHFHAVAHS
jgi:hypothetical protein